MADWQPGDMALCVNDGLGFATGQPVPLKRGSTYIVSSVRPHSSGRIGLFLVGKEAHWPSGFDDSRFVKITPPEADAFDREVIELMTRKPAEVLP